MILCQNTDALQRPVSFLLKVARNPSICPQTLLMSLSVFPEQALQALQAFRVLTTTLAEMPSLMSVMVQSPGVHVLTV